MADTLASLRAELDEQREATAMWQQRAETAEAAAGAAGRLAASYRVLLVEVAAPPRSFVDPSVRMAGVIRRVQALLAEEDRAAPEAEPAVTP